MEIHGIGQNYQTNQLFRHTGAEPSASVPGDSFSPSSTTNTPNTTELAAKMLFGSKDDKGSKILQTATLPGGEKAMLSRSTPKPPGGNADFSGNMIPGENNNFFRAVCRKDAQGNFKYSLAQIDSHGKITGERSLFSLGSEETVKIAGGSRNCVCIHADNRLFVSAEGKPAVEFAVNSTSYARVKQSDNGTVFFLDQSEPGVVQSDSGKLTAIGPDGEVKWKRQSPLGELSCNERGDAYVHTKYKNLYEFKQNGEVDDLSSLYEQDHSFRLCASNGDNIAVVRGASRAGVHDTLTLYTNKKESFRWQSEGMIDNVKFDAANNSNLVLTSEWRAGKLTALDNNGNVKWDMKLPEKGTGKHSLATDQKGNIILTMEIGEYTDIPDSFKTLTEGMIKTKDLKEPGNLMLVISPEGSPLMLHKDKEEMGGRSPKRVFSDGTIAFSSDNGHMETITKGDKAQQVYEELTRPQPEKEGKNPGISVDKEAGEVNIGGVKLPIGKKR